MGNGEDRRACETVLRGLGVSQERLDRIRQRISDFREEWDNVRRPSRPAGPGRPRGHKRANASDPMEAVDPLPETSGTTAFMGQGAGAVMGTMGVQGAVARKVQKKAPCKSKPLTVGTTKGAGSGSAAGGGSAAGALQTAGWQPPPGAESPEDYVLPPSQSDPATGPVAAIVIEDDKSGLWHNSYPEREGSPPVSPLPVSRRAWYLCCAVWRKTLVWTFAGVYTAVQVSCVSYTGMDLWK